MVNIVLNERACAEEALEKLQLGQKPVETLSRIAKYYYSNGYKKPEISKMLEGFLLKCEPTANVVKWQNVIDHVSGAADKYPLIDIPGIPITKAEIEKIQQLNGKMLQRLMFTMLCLAKYGNAVSARNNNWVNRTDKDIFYLANIAITTKRQALMMNDLWRAGYIGYSKVVDNVNVNVRIVDNEGPAELVISDFRNLGNQYMRYTGERYIECKCCGLVIRKESNAHQYCKNCAAEVNRQMTLENWKRGMYS